MSARCRHALLVASLALCALLLRPATEAVGVALSLPAPQITLAADANAAAHEPAAVAPTGVERLGGFERDVELVADAHSR